jgi:hypothetical protein
MIFNHINKVIQRTELIIKTVPSRSITSQGKTTVFLSILAGPVALLSLIPIGVYGAALPVCERNVDFEIFDASSQELAKVADFIEGMSLVWQVTNRRKWRQIGGLGAYEKG